MLSQNEKCPTLSLFDPICKYIFFKNKIFSLPGPPSFIICSDRGSKTSPINLINQPLIFNFFLHIIEILFLYNKIA